MKKNNKKGFTLVELLATITIIGILAVVSIVAVTKLIDRSKKEQREHQKEILALAAEGYMQSNRGQLPKSIGETTTIDAMTLKNNKYLTENIKDGNKKSCMENSYVIVLKVSKTKYDYQTHLYCGNEQPPEDQTKAKPTIKIEFLDADGKLLENDSTILNKVREARFRIALTGGTKGGTQLELDGYSYAILAGEGTTGAMREVYSSGTLTANRNKSIVVDGKYLADYVSITDATRIEIKVNARNVTGGVSDVTITLGGGYEEGSSGTTYQDKNKPKCGTQNPKVTDWLNKNSTVKTRTITVPCTDKGESGCVRDNYTKTWPNEEEAEAETGIITIKDNAGNSTNCTVDVKVDFGTPVITLDAYKRKQNGTKEGNSVLSGAIKTTEGAANDTVTISTSQYTNLVNVYMNNTNYPYGVVYEVTLKDNLALDKVEWKTNAKNLKSSSDKYRTVSLSNDDKYDGTSKCSGKKECTFTIGFLAEGQRYGELVVQDKAGNTAKYIIYANLDRTAPKVPSVTYKLSGTTTAYTQGNWATKAVQSYITDGSNTDTLSGWGKYQYSFSQQNDGTPTAPKWANAVTGDVTNGTTGGYKVTPEGTHKLKYRNCDNAGNCSAYSTEHTIKVDTVAPTCTVSKANLSDSYKPNGAGWYKKILGLTSGEADLSGARVSRTCVEGGNSKFASGCDTTKNGYYDFIANINTTKAGSAGDNKGGTVSDKAGNTANCAANQTVKVDKTEPRCGTPVNATTNWVNYDVTVKQQCSDAESDCVKSEYPKPYTDEGYSGFDTIEDNAGNIATCFYDVYIDKTAPNELTAKYGTTEIDTSATYKYADFDISKLSFSCKDPIHNGVTSGLKSITVNGNAVTSLTKPSKAGTYEYKLVCTDNANNSTSKTYSITLQGNETYGCGASGNKIWRERICTPYVEANGYTDFTAEGPGAGGCVPGQEGCQIKQHPKYGFHYVCAFYAGNPRVHIKVSEFNCETKLLYGCRKSGTDKTLKTGLTEKQAKDWIGWVDHEYTIEGGESIEIGSDIAKRRSEDVGWTYVKCEYDTSKPNNVSCTHTDSAYKYEMGGSGNNRSIKRIKCTTYNNLYSLSTSLGKTDQYIRCSWNTAYGDSPCGNWQGGN